MDMRTVPPVINSAPNASVTGSAPQLGAMVPGTTGGMPAVGGLSVTQNPMAKQLQSYGRGDDKMLVHMTPGEVSGLQQLAMAHGGSLTINPHTGLPEAGWLGKLLPTLIGFGLAATGVGAPLAAGMVAAGQTALTGDLSKGLMAGLGAFGGAGLAGAVGAGAAGAAANTVASTAGAGAGGFGSSANLASGLAADSMLANAATTAGTTAAKTGIGGFLSNFGQSVTQGLPAGTPSMITKAAPMMAGMGVLQGVSGAMQPKIPTYDEEAQPASTYKGPYVPGKREVMFQSDADMRSSGGAEGTFFTPSNPRPRLVSDLTPEERAEYGYAEGGLAELPASDDFKAAMKYFGANSPGAITASMRPTTPKQADVGEVISKFDRKPSAPAIMGGGGGGYNFDLSNLSGLDINGLLNQYGYNQNTPVRGEVDVGPAINNPAVSSPGNVPNFSAPDIMDFGASGRDRFEPGYRPEMLNIRSPEDTYPEYSAPAMQELQYNPPAMQDFQYTPPAMEELQYNPPAMQDFQYTPPAMEELQYNPPAMQDFQYTPPAMQEPQYAPPSAQDLQQYAPPAMQEIQYTPPSAQDLQQYAPPAMQEIQYTPPSAQDFQYTPPAMEELQYNPPSMQDFQQEIQQYAPPSLQEAQYAPSSLYEDMNFAIPDKLSRIRDDEYAQYDALGEFARGGEVNMRDGSFVVDARTVSELGNGSSNAGMELLARMGGRPLQGPGDGVSDSIRARIGGKQEARVARDEVLFSPEAVKRLGKGSDKRGTAKLYALMDKAHKARKNAKRGQDTKVRKGLA
jgi:hypothetical protein